MIKSFILLILLLIDPALAISETNACYSTDDFREFNRCSTIQEIQAKIGNPEKDIGSGIHILQYPLCDGSIVLVGSSNMKKVQYIKVMRDEKIVEEILSGPVMYEIKCPSGKLKLF